MQVVSNVSASIETDHDVMQATFSAPTATVPSLPFSNAILVSPVMVYLTHLLGEHKLL